MYPNRAMEYLEDMDIVSIEGDLSMSASALIDTNGVSESPIAENATGIGPIERLGKVRECCYWERLVVRL